MPAAGRTTFSDKPCPATETQKVLVPSGSGISGCYLVTLKNIDSSTTVFLDARKSDVLRMRESGGKPIDFKSHRANPEELRRFTHTMNFKTDANPPKEAMFHAIDGLVMDGAGEHIWGLFRLRLTADKSERTFFYPGIGAGEVEITSCP